MSKYRLALLLALMLPPGAAWAAEAAPGRNVGELLSLARQSNPELSMVEREAEAYAERTEPAGALPDPKFRAELRDITKFGEQNPTLAPNRVGSTRYLLMQDVPWFGKRDLKREIAEFEAVAATGRAMGTWAELAARIKTLYAQLYYVRSNEALSREVLELMLQLEKVAQARYAGGLAVQQDVIRSQVEQTNMNHELLALESERRALIVRMNTLLARAATAPLALPEALRPLPAPAKLDLAALEDRVRARNPLLFTEEARIKAAEKSRELVYKNRYPDFNFGVSPIQYGSAIKEWELMVEVNIPLQQASRRAQERESEAMLAAAQARKSAAANQILAELAANVAGIESARHAEMLVATRLLPQAEISFQSALAGYENGKVDFATLLDAQRQIRLARQTRIKAEAETQARLAEIERLLGEDL
jgi:outer membrane protein TolC